MKKFLIIALLLWAAFLSAQNLPLTVIAPNGGEIWEIGSTQNILWSQQNLSGSVRLMLLGANSNVGSVIAQNIPVNAGSFTWTIPNSILPGNFYKVGVYLVSPAGTTLGDTSDGFFSLVTTNPPPPPPPDQSVTVLSPNGGEIWQPGSTYPITWTSQGLEGQVRITVVQANGVQDIQIATEVPIESGVFNWTIPATFPTGNGFKVHVMWLSLLAVYFGDLSDGVFTIANPNPPPPIPLSIISPNGGENWQTGTLHPILWTAPNMVGNIDLMLFNGMNSNAGIPIVTGVPVGAGVFNWNIPANLIASNNYYVRISSADPSTGVFATDFSDAPFTISGGTNPSLIQVLSPNGGEQWQIGNSYPIQWVSPMLAGVYEVALMRANQAVPVLVIAPNIPGILALNWTIPPTVPPGTNYKIRVRLAETNGTFDLSDGFFSIVGTPNPQSLTVTSPNGGEVWTKGNTYPITWTANDNSGTVNIWILRVRNNLQQRHIIAQNVPNTGSYNWTIPLRLLPGNGYYVLIRHMNNTASGDRSDAPFTILGQLVDVDAKPNPSKGPTSISLKTEAPVSPEIAIYNLKGQLVRNLSSGKTYSGNAEIAWDGKDARGQAVTNGIYFVRAVNGTEVLSKRIVIVK